MVEVISHNNKLLAVMLKRLRARFVELIQVFCCLSQSHIVSTIPKLEEKARFALIK